MVLLSSVGSCICKANVKFAITSKGTILFFVIIVSDDLILLCRCLFSFSTLLVLQLLWVLKDKRITVSELVGLILDNGHSKGVLIILLLRFNTNIGAVISMHQELLLDGLNMVDQRWVSGRHAETIDYH